MPHAPSWIDELFSLYVSGALRPLSANDVCRAIDWIASRPSLLEPLERADPTERRRQLESLLRTWARSHASAPEREGRGTSA